ncbi:MAG: hypothetical protein RID91_21890 [Azospirillaceae bacterium]
MSAQDPDPPVPDPAAAAATPDGPALVAAFGRVAEAVELARETAAAGGLVDMAGLDRRVDALCRAVVALPADDARRFETVLDDLIGRLDALAATVRAQGPAGTEETGAGDAATRRVRASLAYGRPKD